MRRVVVAAVLRTVVALSNPRREPLKKCTTCGTDNEPERTTCINPSCRAAL